MLTRRPPVAAEAPEFVRKVLGPMIVRMGTFIPFEASYYLNGHSHIEQELRKAGVGFRKDDNAFVAVRPDSRLSIDVYDYQADKPGASRIKLHLHGGNTRTVIHLAPFPLTIAKASGATLTDEEMRAANLTIAQDARATLLALLGVDRLASRSRTHHEDQMRNAFQALAASTLRKLLELALIVAVVRVLEAAAMVLAG